jgi:Mrp family chromosome partitioning ATPase
LAFETVKKLASMLEELKIPILGIVENMKMNHSEAIRVQTRKLGLTYLIGIPYDPQIEETIGKTNKLLDTRMGKEIEQLVSHLG